MDRSMNMNIVAIEYSSESSKIDTEIKDLRMMDAITKSAVYSAIKLYQKVRADELGRDRLGVIVGTKHGALASINEMSKSTESRGYIGINPSLFPNIMLSTCLSRIASALKINGPSAVMYLQNHSCRKEALRYARIQIMKNRADGMFVIFAEDEKKCFGLYIERKETRGMSFLKRC